MSSKRLNSEEPIYPPKKRALYEHKRQSELSKHNSTSSQLLLEENCYTKNDFLALKMKLECSQSEMICMRPRSDSLHSMHSLTSDPSETVSSTTSREPSPNMELFDSRTPERNPVSNFKRVISKPLFPVGFDNETLAVQNSQKQSILHMPFEIRHGDLSKDLKVSETVNSNATNITTLKTFPSVNAPNHHEREPKSQSMQLLSDYQSTDGHQNSSSKDELCNNDNQVYANFQHMLPDGSVPGKESSNSSNLGPMVSLLSKFNKEAIAAQFEQRKSSLQANLSSEMKNNNGLNVRYSDGTAPLNIKENMFLPGLKMYKCRICSMEYEEHDQLKGHMKAEHSGPLPYVCEHCDRAFSQYNNLQRHLRVHRAKIYKCQLCDREFNEEFYLNMHMGTHTGRRVYSCGVCSAAFTSNQDLKLHVKTHSPSQLHTCNICHKSFSKACVLRQHKKGHSGVRPHKCTKCPKTFIHRHHLTMHLKSHADDKPDVTTSSTNEKDIHAVNVRRSMDKREDREASQENLIKGDDYEQRKVVTEPARRAQSEKQAKKINDSSTIIGTVEPKVTQKLPSLSEAFPVRSQHNLNTSSSHQSVMQPPSSIVSRPDQISAHNQPISQYPMPFYHPSFMGQSHHLHTSMLGSPAYSNLYPAYNAQLQAYYSSLYRMNYQHQATLERTTEQPGFMPSDAAALYQTARKSANMDTQYHTRKTLDTDTQYHTTRKFSDHDMSAQYKVTRKVLEEDIHCKTKRQSIQLSSEAVTANLDGEMKEKQNFKISSDERNELERKTEIATELVKMSESMSQPNTILSSRRDAHTEEIINQHRTGPTGKRENETKIPLSNQSVIASPHYDHREVKPSSKSVQSLSPHSLSFQLSVNRPETSLGHTYTSNSGASVTNNLPSTVSSGNPFVPTGMPPYNIHPQRDQHLSYYQNMSNYQVPTLNPFSFPYWMHMENERSRQLQTSNSQKKRHYSSQDVYIVKKPVRIESGQKTNRQRHQSEHPNIFAASYENHWNKFHQNSAEDLKNYSHGSDTDLKNYSQNTVEGLKNHEQNIAEDLKNDSQSTAMDLKNYAQIISEEKEIEPTKIQDSSEMKVLSVVANVESPDPEDDISQTDDIVNSIPNDSDEVELEIRKDDRLIDQVQAKEVKLNYFMNDSLEEKKLEIDLDQSLDVDGKCDASSDEADIIVSDIETNINTVIEHIVSSSNTVEVTVGDVTSTVNITVDKVVSNLKVVNNDYNECGKDLIDSKEAISDNSGKNLNYENRIPEHVNNSGKEVVDTHSTEMTVVIVEADTSGALDLSLKEQEHESMMEGDMIHENNADTDDSALDGFNTNTGPMDLSMTKEKIGMVNVGKKSANKKRSLKNSDLNNVCGICWKKFKNSVEFENHQIEHAKKLESKSKCQFCQKVFVRPFDLQCHIIKHRETGSTPLVENNVKDVKSGYENVNVNQSEINYNFKGYQSSKVESLSGPLSEKFVNQSRKGNGISGRHVDTSVFKCEICSREFSHKHNLNRHKMSHNEKSFECSICKRSFKEKFYLQMHMKTHAEEKTRECEICGVKVPKSELLKHTKEHLGNIARNPTYEQIGSRVNEILTGKTVEQNSVSSSVYRQVLGERKLNLLQTTNSIVNRTDAQTPDDLENRPGVIPFQNNLQNKQLANYMAKAAEVVKLKKTDFENHGVSNAENLSYVGLYR